MTACYRLLGGAAICALMIGVASAQTSDTNAQIQLLQQQIQQMQQQLQSLQNQVNAQAAQPPAAAPSATAANAIPMPHLTQTPGHRFGIQSADGQNSIALSMQLQFDAGDYLSYHPDSAATGVAHGLSAATPHDLNSGVNARRARFGVVGTIAGDWGYTFVWDFGGSQDSGSGGTTNPGAGAGIEKGYITYNGLYNGPFPVAFDLGYQDVPYTLDEATSSNDILFMERASSQVIAANIAAGDFRSAAGIRSNDDRYWAGVYVTGPTSGTTHSFPEQYGMAARAAYQLLQEQDYTLHVGADFEALLKAPSTTAAPLLDTLTLSDRPELRIDPTSIISTGALGTAGNQVSGAQVYSYELAGNYENLFAQSEGFVYQISRYGLPDNTFYGGYLQGAWTITGEQHKYNPAAGAYGGITPAVPFSLKNGGWGAWELAARYSYMNLDDNVASALAGGAAAGKGNGIVGGRQQVMTLGLNWYPNNNIRFDLDYLHGLIDKTSTAGENGASFDALAARAQVQF